jgi:hypothetical protein
MKMDLLIRSDKLISTKLQHLPIHWSRRAAERHQLSTHLMPDDRYLADLDMLTI